MKIRNMATLIALLILCLTAHTASAQQSFEAENTPGYFVRHSNFFGVLSRISSTDQELDRDDATFIQRRGLAEADGAQYRGSLSFESFNYPGYFLRHENFQIRISRDSGSELFRKDASFWPRPGGTHTTGLVRYEAVNVPRHFIRHKNFQLSLEKDNGSAQFYQDSRFYDRPPLAFAAPHCTVQRNTYYYRTNGPVSPSGVLNAGTQGVFLLRQSPGNWLNVKWPGVGSGGNLWVKQDVTCGPRAVGGVG